MRGHESDLVLWSDQQAKLLCRMVAGKHVTIIPGRDNIAEEIDSLGRSEASE